MVLKKENKENDSLNRNSMVLKKKNKENDNLTKLKKLPRVGLEPVVFSVQIGRAHHYTASALCHRTFLTRTPFHHDESLRRALTLRTLNP